MNDLVIRNLDDLGRVADMFVKSQLFKDVRQVQAAGVLIMAGLELGLQPMTSIRGLHIIQGKVVMSSGLMATLVKRSSAYDYRISKDSGDTSCTLEWFDNTESVGKSSFTIEEAKIAGLLGNPVWKKYPSDMLFARALSRGVKRFAPDVLGGNTYVEGEIDEQAPINVTPKAEPVVKVEKVVDPERVNIIARITALMDTVNKDDRQDIKNEWMDRTQKDFPSKSWSGLPTNQLNILLGMLIAKDENGELAIDEKGCKVISDAFESLDATDKERILAMFSDKYGDWVDIDQQTEDQLSQMELWLNIEVQK
jgi:hypothetical protein